MSACLLATGTGAQGFVKKMSFVNAALLLGMGMIAVPIILHLVMRRKPRHFEFPALRFVRQQRDRNQRRLRLRHLLLLVLRCLAVCLLALSLARPTLSVQSSATSREAPVAAALIFDTAPRMQYLRGNQSRLDEAKRLGLWLLNQLPEESQIAVFDSRGGPGAFHADASTAKLRIERLESSSFGRPLPEIIEEAAQLLKQSERDRHELYIFTDATYGAWPASGAARMQSRLADLGDAAIYMIDVGVERPINTYLGLPRLSAQVLSTQASLTLVCELGRLGDEGNTQTRVVELLLIDEQGQMLRVGSETVEITAGQTRQIEFRMGNLASGVRQGVIRVLGQDGLAADDERYFTVAVRKPWRLLLVAPPPADEYAYFVRNALAPETARLRGQSRFVCEPLDQRRLIDQDLTGYDSLWLLDPGPMEPLAWKKVADFAAEGRGVVICLGRNVGRPEAFASAAALELLPGRPALQARRPEGDFFFAPRDYEHPILGVFRPVAGTIPWRAFPIFRFWQFDDLANEASVVIVGNDGSPVVFERPLGAGRVITLATPLSDRPDAKAWNLLPVGVIDNAAPFVMFCHQLANYSVGATDEQFNYTCGQTAVLQLDRSTMPRSGFILITPGDLRMPLAAEPSAGRLFISGTDEPGNYRVFAGGGDNAIELGFSANIAPEQTDLDRIPLAELRQIFGPFSFPTPARTQEQLQREVSTQRVGRELSGILLLILALVCAGEYLTANRFYRDTPLTVSERGERA